MLLRCRTDNEEALFADADKLPVLGTIGVEVAEEFEDEVDVGVEDEGTKDVPSELL